MQLARCDNKCFVRFLHRPEGRKYQAAQRNNIACVNAKWIVDLYQGKLNTLSADVDCQYTTFTNADNNLTLDRTSATVQRLMGKATSETPTPR